MLRKVFLFLVISLEFIKICCGQTNIYHSIPDSGALWRIHEIDYSYPNIPWYALSDYQYFSGGDTVISGLSWTKIYISGNFQMNTPNQDIISFPGPLRALIKMDTVNGQLLVFPMDGCINCDTIEFDYSLNVGDTLFPQINTGNFFPSFNAYYVGSVDSVIVDGSFRKRLNVYDFNTNNFTGVSLIEGVGGTQGLLEGYDFFEQYNTLECYSINGNTLFPDTAASCSIVSYIQENKDQSNSVSVFPNPSSGIILVESKENVLHSLRIYTVSGLLIDKIDNLNTNKYFLDVNHLANGIYILKIIDKTNTAIYLKFSITK